LKLLRQQGRTLKLLACAKQDPAPKSEAKLREEGIEHINKNLKLDIHIYI
jgi:hypothetical protein